jgi:alpha-N-arabinofuranosidase
MTNANGVVRQTIYYPYSWGLQMAHGAVLNLLSESPVYEVSGIGTAPYLDVVGTFSKENGQLSLFIPNRDLASTREIDVVWEDASPTRVLSSAVLTGNDLKAFNSFSSPKRVIPMDLAKPVITGGHTKFEVPPRSYTVLQWGM